MIYVQLYIYLKRGLFISLTFRDMFEKDVGDSGSCALGGAAPSLLLDRQLAGKGERQLLQMESSFILVHFIHMGMHSEKFPTHICRSAYIAAKYLYPGRFRALH